MMPIQSHAPTQPYNVLKLRFYAVALERNIIHLLYALRECIVVVDGTAVLVLRATSEWDFVEEWCV